MTYPRLLWKGHGYRIIEMNDGPIVYKDKSADQPYCVERKADANALGGETWLPVTDNSPAGRVFIHALIETVREHESERESDEADDS